MANFQKNQEYQGQVLDLTSKGEGVVKVDGFAFFVEGGLPGEDIRFKVLKVGKKFGYGKLIEVLVASPDRVTVTDPLGSQIGTMTLQHLAYPAQLKYKQDLVKRDFERIGHFKDIQVDQTLGMDHPWDYRNKAQVPVRQDKHKVETGFFRKGSHDLVPIDNFYIQDPIIDKTLIKLRRIIQDLDYSAYDEATGKGLIRHLVVRRGYHSGQIMVIVVINGKSLSQIDIFCQRVRQAIPDLVSLVVNYNQSRGNAILGRTHEVIWGQDYYEDQMLGLDFRISPHSFYQVNTPQAEVLYQLALDAADLKGTETVLDAYCGIGTISLALARQARHVYAMEVVAEAIAMAQENAKINHLDNVTFQAGKAEDVLPSWQAQGLSFDVAVVDPPRKGLDSTFIDTLIDLGPDKIVYVSCNPSTCARDCRKFADSGYQVRSIQPVDMFPQTTHVETVLLMSRK